MTIYNTQCILHLSYRLQVGEKMEYIKIERVNLVDAVYTQLKEQIVSGKIPEGSKLDSENKLAASLNVSRVVIREALSQLRTERLIITRQGAGTFVANPENFRGMDEVFGLSEDVYRQFLAFRECVESKAVLLSKDYATKEDFEYLDQCLIRMRQSVDDLPEFNEADYDFHLGVVLCSHNVFLENAMRANRKQILSIFEAMNSVPGANAYGIASHVAIKDLLEQRKVKEALKRYEEMSSYNIARLEQFFQHSK